MKRQLIAIAAGTLFALPALANNEIDAGNLPKNVTPSMTKEQVRVELIAAQRAGQWIINAEHEVTGGSVSWLHPAGYNVTFGTTTRQINAARDGKFNYLKLGYKWGDHAVSADFALADDQNAAGDEAKMVGIAYVYKPAKWAELYALAKNHSLDRPGSAFEDIRIVMAGTRLKF